MLHDIFGTIPERDSPIFYPLFHFLQFYRILRVLYGIHRRQNEIDPHHRGQPFLYGVSGFGQIFRRIDNAVKNNQIVNERSGIDTARSRQDERAAIPKDDTNGTCA